MQFNYRIRLANTDREVSGRLEASDLAQAEAALRADGFQILSIKPRVSLSQLLTQRPAARLSRSQVLELTEQLGSLLDAGLPIDRALKLLRGTLPGESARHIVGELLLDIERGSTLAAAFERHGATFPGLYVNMVRAGEEGGILPLTLRRLIEFYERSIEFRNFLISSSIYPITLLLFGISAIAVLTLAVIPKFADVFDSMGQELPGSAAFLIGASSLLSQHGLELLAAGLILGLTAWAYGRTRPGQLWWHGLVLRLPLLGSLLLKANLSRACRTMGTLLQAGVPILKALHIVSRLSENIHVNQALGRLERGIRDGEGLAAPMRNDPFFPPLLSNLVSVGEETGDVGAMLIKVAEQYDADVRKAAKRLIALFEPTMIIIMGGLIGAIVLSMLSAIFSINDMGL
ncbi:type II secretion system F family protein [Chitinimonas sp. JJ19]|uniref:type II secretion system F family protein n=1 Tax=Chitinimonas sp. JJ19 TaxID=3109352 RepID=UPI00300242C1